MSNFSELKKMMLEHGLQVPDEKITIKIENPKQKMAQVFSMFVPDFKWIEPYDKVASWLENNNGKGLFMYGNCGTGKTMLAKYVLPAILLHESRLVVKYYDVGDLRSKFDGLTRCKIFSLDDVGTEEISSNYGNKIDMFPELMDSVEKKSKLAIITTNIDRDDIEKRYGLRVFERIIATTERVCFNSKSFRR